MKAYECWYQIACREDTKLLVVATSMDKAIELFAGWAASTRPPKRAEAPVAMPYELQMIRETGCVVIL